MKFSAPAEQLCIRTPLIKLCSSNRYVTVYLLYFVNDSKWDMGVSIENEKRKFVLKGPQGENFKCLRRFMHIICLIICKTNTVHSTNTKTAQFALFDATMTTRFFSIIFGFSLSDITRPWNFSFIYEKIKAYYYFLVKKNSRLPHHFLRVNKVVCSLKFLLYFSKQIERFFTCCFLKPGRGLLTADSNNTKTSNLHLKK